MELSTLNFSRGRNVLLQWGNVWWKVPGEMVREKCGSLVDAKYWHCLAFELTSGRMNTDLNWRGVEKEDMLVDNEAVSLFLSDGYNDKLESRVPR